MIKGNFKIKKIEQEDRSEQELFEDLIEKSGIGSHMVFRTTKKDDELFLDDL
jgi:predicted site-specific integrase-resolvase